MGSAIILGVLVYAVVFMVKINKRIKFHEDDIRELYDLRNHDLNENGHDHTVIYDTIADNHKEVSDELLKLKGYIDSRYDKLSNTKQN